VNSFNTTNHTTLNSGINNSRVYLNQSKTYPNHPNRDSDRAPSASLGILGYVPIGNTRSGPSSMPPYTLPHRSVASLPPISCSVFNTIHVNDNKVDYDQTVHSTNIGFGNRHNVVIQDSYNNNSVRSYAPEPAPRPKRRGPWRP
jgi:hypothetical protein